MKTNNAHRRGNTGIPKAEPGNVSLAVEKTGRAYCKARDALREVTFKAPLCLAQAYLHAAHSGEIARYAVPATALSTQVYARHTRLASALLYAADFDRAITPIKERFVKTLKAYPLASGTLSECARTYHRNAATLSTLSRKQCKAMFGTADHKAIQALADEMSQRVKSLTLRLDETAEILYPSLLGLAVKRVPYLDPNELAQETWLSVQRGLDLYRKDRGSLLRSYLHYWINLGLATGTAQEKTGVRLRHSDEWIERGLSTKDYDQSPNVSNIGTRGNEDAEFAAESSGLSEMYQGIFDGLPDSIQPNPARDMDRYDHLRLLEIALRKLSRRQRKALVMYYGLTDKGPLTFQEVADQIGGTRQNAQLVISKAIKAAREAFNEDKAALNTIRQDLPQ